MTNSALIVRQQSAYKNASDEGRAAHRSNVYKFLIEYLTQSAPDLSKAEITKHAWAIHGAFLNLERYRARLTVTRDESGRVNRKRNARIYSAGRELDRLEQAAKSGGYKWVKAWSELSPDTFDLIYYVAGSPQAFNAGPFVQAPGFFPMPGPELVLPLLSNARAIASCLTNARPDRDAAVIAILRAFIGLTGERVTSPNDDVLEARKSPVLRFIEDVEGIYAALIPDGLAIGKSKSLFERLAKAASEN